MTVILVLCTLLLFLSADYAVQRLRGRRMKLAAGWNRELPAGTELLANHTWLRREPRGDTVIGLDGLVARALGTVQQVLLPEAGSSVDAATARITMAARGRSLKIHTPVAGHVVAVNNAVLRNPALVHADPYGNGWLIRIRPAEAGSSPYAVENPIEWLRAQGEAMKEFFRASSAQPGFATMQDGGEPVEGILQTCDAGVWKSFNETFAALQPLEAADVARETR